ncbi:YMGG-like glycine zipper-containing protein [Lignipirellula cremea]|uniref:Glycine zipper 2TM domain protein n=1 Tax=Lignipirellula cremea TaxID=2528010 RepID=A0A518DRI9_9BACT|nr:glycine zipper domain-containing protein [Lignipirellula cremea]QDU94457.1 Glycine zipper 2TM domain protein [Lignipirellula cremea]
MKSTHLLLAAVAMSTALSGCQSPYYKDQGAALGALGGAGLGAVIGEHNDNPLAGAAIGAGIGALTGAVIGDGIDRDQAYQRAAIESQVGRQVAGAATVGDVIEMTRAGVSEQVIVNHVRSNGVAQQIGRNEIVAMTQAGVGPNVISTMQTTGLPALSAPPARPVIVEEHYYTPRPYYPRYYHHHHHHRPRPHCGPSWGFSAHF